MRFQEYTSDELLEHVSQVIAEDLENGYELVHVTTDKDITQGSREIEMTLRKQ